MFQDIDNYEQSVLKKYDISCHYYGMGSNPTICIHCGGAENINDTDKDFYPMCETCISDKLPSVKKLGKKNPDTAFQSKSKHKYTALNIIKILSYFVVVAIAIHFIYNVITHYMSTSTYIVFLHL